MAEINVYQQYYSAQGTFNGVPRHAASVLLISNSEAGSIIFWDKPLLEARRG